MLIPETTDIYDRKNLPCLIFCLHALAVYLYRLGLAPRINRMEDGELTRETLKCKTATYFGVSFSSSPGCNFSQVDVIAAREALEDAGMKLPRFGDISHIVESSCRMEEAKRNDLRRAATSRRENTRRQARDDCI